MRDSARSRRGERGSFIVDSQGTILGFNEGLEQLTGWQAVDVVGRDKASIRRTEGAKPVTVPLYNGDIPMVRDSRCLTMELNCQDGRCLEVESVASLLDGPGDRVLVSVMRVLSRSADAGPTVAGADSDPLTGLANTDGFHRYLLADAHAAIAAARPMALILLNVDHLRDLNDSRGREAGDEVLRQIAGILRVAVDDDQRIFRLSDDNFAVLLADSGRGEARQIAAAIRSAVERHRFFTEQAGDSGRAVTVSLGAASLPTDADSADDLLARTREALGEARSMGRNRVWCYLRRPRVPLSVPVFFDGAKSLLVGYTRDLSPSGIFVQTSAPIDIGMRCALAFALPGQESKVHVIGRIVRTVPPEMSLESMENRVPGMGVEFERFSHPRDRVAIDAFLHGMESTSLRPESGILSV